jgi:nucleoside permease NupC
MAFAADFQRRLSLLDQGRSAEAVVEAHDEQESNVIEAAINGATAPKQTRVLAQVALRSLVAATLACLMIAAIAGVFYGKGLRVPNLEQP